LCSNGLRQTPVEKSTLKANFPLAQFCAAPYKQSREAALPLLPFLGVSSLMNWPGGFAGLFLAIAAGRQRRRRSLVPNSGLGAVPRIL
jgi:hypothetical protein